MLGISGSMRVQTVQGSVRQCMQGSPGFAGQCMQGTGWAVQVLLDSASRALGSADGVAGQYMQGSPGGLGQCMQDTGQCRGCCRAVLPKPPAELQPSHSSLPGH